MSKKYSPPWHGTTWFMRRRGYTMFMVRELTSGFLAIYLVMLLHILRQLQLGPESFTALLAEMKSPLWMTLHVMTLIGVVWHAITWFNVTPQAMPVFIGEKRAPGPLVAIGMGYLPWFVISAVIVWLLCP